MLLTLCLLFIGLHVSEGCTLENPDQAHYITGSKGWSALLPCSCTDINTKPESLTWLKLRTVTNTFEEISFKSPQYKNRVQLVNDQSPGNLSLLISHLTEEDGGDYRCEVKERGEISFRLTVKVCTLENNKQLKTITAPTGGSVLLPCSCTDLQTTPEKLTWYKHNTIKTKYEEISRESGQYRNRVQLFNYHSPGNLSLLISQLTEEDGGEYRCEVIGGGETDFRLTVKEGPNTTVTSSPPDSGASSQTSSMQFIIIPVLLLLLGLGGVIYWRYKRQRQGQIQGQRQGQRQGPIVRGESKSESQKTPETQDNVTYSTVAYSGTARTPTVTNPEDQTEYASIKVN